MRRTLLVAGVASLVLAAGAAAFLAREEAPPLLAERALADRPELLLLTSLPLMFGEQFSLDGGGSAALAALSRRYTIRPIALADATSLTGHRLLLMAHPRAQTAEALVDLDAWVRQGGRVLLLADPALDWPSERPLGDALRPPPGFADTGLLGHWGVTLAAPDARGPVIATLDGRTLTLSSPGRLTAAACKTLAGDVVARCSIERGRVTIIADADLLDPGLSGAGIGSNLDALAAELERFER